MPKPREAGRELDALIAEMIFGATWSDSDDGDRSVCSMRRMLGMPKRTLRLPNGHVLCWQLVSGAMLIPDDGPGDNLPHYSTDIAAAMLVVETLAEHQPHPRMLTATNWHYYGDRYWTATFASHTLGPADVTERGETLALAICRAALSVSKEGASNG